MRSQAPVDCGLEVLPRGRLVDETPLYGARPAHPLHFDRHDRPIGEELLAQLRAGRRVGVLRVGPGGACPEPELGLAARSKEPVGPEAREQLVQQLLTLVNFVR